MEFTERVARHAVLIALGIVFGTRIVSAQSAGYSTSFDNSTGWTLTSSTTNVKWLVDATPMSVPGGAFKSTPTSLNYNNGTSYATSSTANNGKAKSPSITIGSLTSPKLKFWCNYQTETNSTSYDKRFVRILNTAATPTVLLSVQCATMGGGTGGMCSPMGTWHEHTIDLDPTWATIHVEFFFDTVDGVSNNFAGWFVDDMNVSGTGSPPPPPPPPPGGGGSGGQASVVKEWKFDSGLAGWTATAPMNNVGWAADATPATIGTTNTPSYVSSPNSLNYNNGTNFDSGSTNTGSVTSPSIDLTGVAQPKIKLSCNYQTETTGLTYDKRYLKVSKDNFTTTVVDLQLATTANAPAKCDVMGKWHTHEIDIDPSWGSIQVRFAFDSGDGVANNYAGWFVDDVQLLGVVQQKGQATVVEEWKFDGGLTPWTATPPVSNVGWAADATPATIGTSNTPSYVSSPNSLNYNNGKDYASGNTKNSGSATSPSVDLSAMKQPKLKFSCNYETETTGTTYDKRYLKISKDNFTTTVADLQLATTATAPAKCDVMGKWHTHDIDLDPTWGTVQIRFFLDTVDEVDNDSAGWFVDDVQIIAFVEGGDGVVGGTKTVGRVGGHDRSPMSALGCIASTVSEKPRCPFTWLLLVAPVVIPVLLRRRTSVR